MREAKTINNITKGSKMIHLFQLVRKKTFMASFKENCLEKIRLTKYLEDI